MSDHIEQRPMRGQMYRHHTGRVYEIICIAREEDLGVDFVIHRGLHDGRTWARSLANFNGVKNEQRRFVIAPRNHE